MRIGNFDLDERVMIVAEIGNNHEGSVTLAEQLIGLAAEAGVDAVKFQTFQTEQYISRCDRRRFEQLKSFELTFDHFRRLSRAAAGAGVLFLSTPLDRTSAQFLNDLVAAYKVASGDNTFYPLLETIAATGRPVIVSTGLATLDEIASAKRTIESVWSERGIGQSLALLHCVSSYPTASHDANLRALGTLKETFQCTVGYSDHTLGIEAAVLSVAAGARIVEKHFTISKDYSDFRDHQLSADPPEMATLVGRIREAERMMGDGARVPRPCERDLIGQLRRRAVARRDLPTGAVLTQDDVIWLRPGGGRTPGSPRILFGRSLAVPVVAGRIITPDVLADEAVRPAPPVEPSPANA